MNYPTVPPKARPIGFITFYSQIYLGLTMVDIKVDCSGKNCPVPLIEMRKAIRKAASGDVVEITGDHPASKKEIPMAVESLGQELLDVREAGNKWTIRIRKVKE